MPIFSFILSTLPTILIFLFVIIVLVVGHELGHFFVAKMFGVRVDEFGLGYPPRAKKLFTWKGTLFTLNWLPFGGFVKIFGEDGDPSTGSGRDGENKEAISKNSFSQQKLWKRWAILVAGIMANVVLAVFLYAASFYLGFLGDIHEFPNAQVVSPAKVTITDVIKGTPAERSGLQVNDEIVGVDVDDVVMVPNSANDFITFIHTYGTNVAGLDVLRNGVEKHVAITPEQNIVGTGPSIGVAIEDITLLKMPFWSALMYGFTYTMLEFKMIVVSLCVLVGGLFAGHAGLASQLSGPIGIAKFAGTAFSLGLGTLLSFMGLISVNLAVVNLLPFPALDGGRMILELFSYKGKNRISPKIIAWINQIGFIILIVLMLFVTYHDIFHPL